MTTVIVRSAAAAAILALVPAFAAAQVRATATSDQSSAAASDAVVGKRDFRLLATSKTSTMQKELNEAAAGGYRFAGVMGGETAFGGSEVVTLMERVAGSPASARYEYKLLATSKTSTMQKELDEAGSAGFEYVGQTVYGSAFGGDEVVVILERDLDPEHAAKYEYLLLATNKTSTMQSELQRAGERGFRYLGVTVSKTAFGGSEVLTILDRKVVP